MAGRGRAEDEPEEEFEEEAGHIIDPKADNGIVEGEIEGALGSEEVGRIIDPKDPTTWPDPEDVRRWNSEAKSRARANETASHELEEAPVSEEAGHIIDPKDPTTWPDPEDVRRWNSEAKSRAPANETVFQLEAHAGHATKPYFHFYLQELLSDRQLRKESQYLHFFGAGVVGPTLQSIPGVVRVGSQGSLARGTSINVDMGWDAAKSDADILVVFSGNASTTSFRNHVDSIQNTLQAWVEAENKKLRSDSECMGIYQVNEGRFGLSVSFSEVLEVIGHAREFVDVDVIPAVMDPAGGHWVYDTSLDRVLHNDPERLADLVTRRSRCSRWINVVLLCKLWNKQRAKVPCTDGVARSPMTSLHIEVALLMLPQILPERLDEAMLLGLEHLRQHLRHDWGASVPEEWIGRPAHQYLEEDPLRSEAVEAALDDAIRVLTSGMDPSVPHSAVISAFCTLMSMNDMTLRSFMVRSFILPTKPFGERSSAHEGTAGPEDNPPSAPNV